MYVESIARYPVKGLQPNWLSSVEVDEACCLPLDRRFAFWKFPPSENARSKNLVKPEGWLAKRHLLCVMANPLLVRVAMVFDDNGTTLQLYVDDKHQGIFNLEQKESVAALEEWIGNFLSLSHQCLWLDSKDRPPASGKHSSRDSHGHYADNNFPYISLVNLATLQEMGVAFGRAMEKERFRGNLYIDGGKPWQEQQWIGKTLQVGDVTCEVIKEISRCRATCVHPVSGELDEQVPKKLLQHYGHDCCGVFAIIRQKGQLQKGQTLTIC